MAVARACAARRARDQDLRRHGVDSDALATSNPASSYSASSSVTPRDSNNSIARLDSSEEYLKVYAQAKDLLLTGQYMRAQYLFTKVLSLKPSYANALFNRAVARSHSGDLQGAQADYDKFISLTPRDPDGYQNRGIVRQKLGNKVGACNDWRSAKYYGSVSVNSWILSDCK